MFRSHIIPIVAMIPLMMYGVSMYKPYSYNLSYSTSDSFEYILHWKQTHRKKKHRNLV